MENQNNRSVYYPFFDYLRALCAIAVMLYHAKFLTWHQSGDLAVQVFFALSGWLIGGILVKTETKQLFRFYFNRAIRIWVPYYIALGIFLILSILREPITPKWIEIVIYKITFVYNLFGTQQLAQFAESMPQKATLNHVWSVNAEEQFYLIAPLLLVIGARFLGKNIILWIVLAIAGLAFNTYPSIILGVLAAIANAQTPLIHSISRKNRIGILFGTIVCAFFLTNSLLYPYLSPIFSIAVVILLAIPGQELYQGKTIGGMSYPLYLNHWIGVYAINYIMPSARNTIISVVISSIISIAIATAMYTYIDRKILSKRNAWYTKSRGIWITFFAYSFVIIGIAFGSWMSASNPPAIH